MKLPLITFISALFGFCVSGEDGLAKRSVATFKGKQYELVVMQSDLDRAPLWRPADPNPPLAQRDAVASARKAVSEIPESTDWKVTALTLERVGHDGQWVYMVQFALDREGLTNHTLPHRFKVPVLLNAEVPKLTLRYRFPLSKP